MTKIKKIKLKPITITYSRTITYTPTLEYFDDWDCYPSQSGFESAVLDDFFEVIYNDVEGGNYPKKYTKIVKHDPVVIEFEDEEEDEE